MTDRSRRVRRQISDATDEFSEESDGGSGEEYDPRRSDSMRRAGRYDTSAVSARPKRGATTGSLSSLSAATVQRGGSGSQDDRRQSLKLTVKAPPSKLREVMRANEVDSLEDTLGGGDVLDGSRPRRRAAAPSRASTRGIERPRYAEYGESEIEGEEEEEEEMEEEDDDDDDDNGDDGDEEDEDEEDEPNDFDDLGAEPEGGTDEEDVDMDEADRPRHAPPKPAKITLKPPAKTEGRGTTKPKLVVTSTNVGRVRSLQDKEMSDTGNEGENYSDLPDEEGNNLNDEDANGDEEEEIEEDTRGRLDEEDEMEEDDNEDDDMEDDSDETPASGSATPDLSKLTKRQRGRPEDTDGLMALDMAPQQRKFFTDAEKAMKKDEHARKRKELTKRKVQEEKTAALNRLLKPQASKARGAAPKPETLAAAAAAVGVPFDEEEVVEKANPLYTRWVSTKDGLKLAVPEEWLGKRVGKLFGPPLEANNGVLVQEVE